MLIITPKELIKILERYKEDELLLITWWSTEDVEMIVNDSDAETDKAQEIWGDIIDDLDNSTSDYVISHVNAELDAMVFDKLEDKS